MKKLLSLGIITCSIVLLAGCGNKKVDISDTTTTDTTTVDTTVPTTPAQNGKKVDATKTQCLEIVKYGMNLALAQQKGDKLTVEELTQEAATLEKKLNTDNVEYQIACNKYMSDPSFIQEVQKVTTQMTK